jgi:uncharacterized protein (DUF305 family)
VGRPSVVLALTAAVLLAACGRGASTNPAAASFNASDVRFLQDMIGHHQQAIEMAKLVDGRSHRPQLTKFAAGIAATRQAEISTMRGWSTRWNQPTPPPPATAMGAAGSPPPGMLGRGQLDWLKLLKGPRFDLGFVTMMDTHHGGAVEMAEAELRTGASAEVRTLARRIRETQKAELGQLHEWKDAWSSDAGQASSG